MTAKEKTVSESALQDPLVAALRGADEKRLPALKTEYDRLQGKMDALKREQSLVVDAMRMINLKVHGRKPRAGRPVELTVMRRGQAVDLLRDGRRSFGEIAGALDIPKGSLHKVLDDKAFVKVNGLWELAEAG